MRACISAILGLGCAGLVFGQSAVLPGTEPLLQQGDLSARMVQGIDRYFTKLTEETGASRSRYWQRDFTSVEAYEKSIQGNRDQLRKILGLPEGGASFQQFEFVSNADDPKVTETSLYTIFAVRWPAFDGVHGEGLWLRPKVAARGTVIALPDADQTPELIAGLALGLDHEAQFARRLAESGYEVIVPVLVNRGDRFSGNPEINRFTNQPHREWIYRQAYQLGFHVIGYEIRKVLALVDGLQNRGEKRIGVAGYGEGGLIALYSAALDPRIRSTLVSGYFGPRENLWEEPIYRNVFTLLERFGDAELASMIAPRALVVEYSEAPPVAGPPTRRQGRSGAAPGRIWTPERFEVEAELDRARELFPQGFETRFELATGQEGTPALPGSTKGLQFLARGLGAEFAPNPSAAPPEDRRKGFDPQERQRRQVRELVDFTQHQIVVTERSRNEEFWKGISGIDAARWSQKRPPYAARFWDEWIGRLPDPQTEMNPRSRLLFQAEKWTAYDVVLEVWPDVFAWGILCLPKDLKPGEQRPVVVCQHGLEGVPRDTIDGPESNGYRFYKGFAARLAERGFITFAPHNPYRGEDRFRVLQRKANPLGKSLFSVIIGQHEQILNWLSAQPFVDPERIGFYGLSYGGKTAMRVPAVLERYAVSICSADFNDWILKNATVQSPYSYLFTGEYEMPEFALGRMWNYAEMAALIAPRPFMVERGHDDGVAPDEWVAYEFAKVRRFYEKLGIGDRTTTEFFDGPHTINGIGTFKFLHEHLNWPEPEDAPGVIK